MSKPHSFLPGLLIFCSLLLPVSALALDILAMPTVLGQEMDALQYVPAGSQPAIYPTKRVYRGQPFRLLVLAKDFSTDDSQLVDITYTVQVFAPNDTPLFKPAPVLELYKGPASSGSLLILSQQFLTLDFSETDPFGLYRFQISAHDHVARQAVTTTSDIRLAPFSADTRFDSIDELSDWLINYYRDPDPARAVAALLQYVEPDSLAGEKQSPLLTFLSQAIQGSPFLWPHLKALYTEADTADRKKILLLSALTGQQDTPFFDTLEPEFSSFYAAAGKIRLPEPSQRPTSRIEIDSLWAEFAATGTIAPIRKLVGALYLESTRGTREQLESGTLMESPAILARAVLEDVYQAALGSLVVNGEQHSLVKQYLGIIYEEEGTEPAIKKQLEQILIILQQRANEEEARKHLEKKLENP